MIMQKDSLNNVHISAEQILITPEELKNQFPLSENDQYSIERARKTIADIIQGEIRVCWSFVGPVQFMMWMRHWITRVV